MVPHIEVVGWRELGDVRRLVCRIWRLWIRIRDISSFYERLLQGVVLVDEVTAVVRPGMPQVGISGRARAATDLWNGLRQRVDVIVSPQLPSSL